MLLEDYIFVAYPLSTILTLVYLYGYTRIVCLCYLFIVVCVVLQVVSTRREKVLMVVLAIIQFTFHYKINIFVVRAVLYL